MCVGGCLCVCVREREKLPLLQSLAVCSLVKCVVTEGWNCLETFSFIGDGCSVECEVGLEKSV